MSQRALSEEQFSTPTKLTLDSWGELPKNYRMPSDKDVFVEAWHLKRLADGPQPATKNVVRVRRRA